MRPKSGIPLEVKFYSREKYEYIIAMNVGRQVYLIRL